MLYISLSGFYMTEEEFIDQALGVFIVSYMDAVLVQVHAHKDNDDADILVSVSWKPSTKSRNPSSG